MKATLKPGLTAVVTMLFLLPCISMRPVSAMQNGSSFDQANRATVKYDRVLTAANAASCTGLTGTDSSGLLIHTLRLIGASNSDPEHCLLRGFITRDIGFVLYLPTKWNGRLFMPGNWGDAGEALDDPVARNLQFKALRLGFAVVFTNTGHDAKAEPGATWAWNKPDKEKDYGYRAVHLTVMAAKQIIRRYYARPAEYAYFDGCSTGGRQGLVSAQRYPDDFDGILAGAPVMDLTRMLWQYWKNQMAIEQTPLTDETLSVLADYIVKRFDGIDGVRDNVIADPLAVDFEPRRDLPATGLFTAGQIETIDRIYAPVTVNGVEIFPRTVVGGEIRGSRYQAGTWTELPPVSAWHTRVLPDSSGLIDHRLIVESWFKYVLFDEDDPDRDWRRMAPDRDRKFMTRASRNLDAVDPDLSSFQRRGGKLILYHGWADFGVNPLRSLQYFQSVRQLHGDGTREFLQLYLIPGMQHCWGGTNVDRFDLMSPLIDWVEAGVLPQGIVAGRVENGRTVRTRPLCAWPARPRYQGGGDTDEHGNFSCVAPD